MITRAGWRWWIIAVILGGLLLAGAFYCDADVHEWVLRHRTQRLQNNMLRVSRWGDWPTHVVLGLVAAATAWALGRRDWLRIFLAMIVACALAGAAARVIKVTAGRARPSVAAQDRWSGPSLSSKYHAFPSGHTASSMAFFGVPCFARRRIALVFLAIPVLIATSRVLLDAHHLSDVVFAAELGLVCAFVIWRFVAARFPTPA